ncbi:phospho-acceptor domain-containing protein [Christiangramia gaetbulicola]|uniref:histidine kinase n=1 Tax=Christiangramia gaetbulicola TaxID=703340 RepID=A0A2T6AKM3_9FLAO|nr:ATP-binding protein [Christiangramia gaetbulicola]PTX44368.1 phospho-acceptor domain-containing protein [Christiangramia gaetbulicola]
MSITQKQKNEILNIYQKWLDSYLNGDIDTYDSYFDDNYHFIGSTNNEEFLNRKDTTEFFRKTTDQFAGKTDLRNNITTIEKFGDVIFLTHLFDAWFMDEGDWTYYGRFRFSNALHETKDGWKFIYQHFSIPDAKAEEGETIGFDQISAENLQLREAIQRRTKELEEKSRELQIEMGLEKVRARSLEMQHTNELQDVINTVHRELLNLQLSLSGGAFITINSDIKDELWCWGAGGTAEYVQKVHVPPIDKPIYKNLINGIKKGPGFFTEEFSQAEKIEFFEHLFKFPPYLNADESHKKEVFSREGGYTRSCAVFKNTSIFIINHHGRIFTEHENNVLKRFGSVFEQAYTRFLDLKKAEAQTREAQIETALERVRSRTMAMQHSKELPEAANILFLEIQKLGIPAWSAGYNILSEDKRSSTCIMSSEGEMQEPFVLPLTEHESLLPWHETIIKNRDFFIYGQEGEDLVAHYDYLASLPELKKTFEQFQEAGLDLPTRQFNHLVRFNKGFLLFITYEEVPEAHEIFKRFGKVFEQTYTRFLDLKKAEAQAREAQIEAALERVRSTSLAMHHSSELSSVVDKLLKEFTDLEFTLTFCIINLINEKDRSNTVWAANPETGKDAESYYMKFENYPFHHAMWDAWKAQKKRFIYTLEGEEKKIYDEYLYSETEFRRFPEHVQEANKALERYVAGFTFFEYSGLQTVSEEPISENDLEILERFGRVFEQAYTRFLDLQKAEAQAREAQIEAALERVRSRTMGMQHSSELQETAALLFDQIQALGINVMGCGFNIWNNDRSEATAWMSGMDRFQPAFQTSSSKDIFLRIYEAMKRGDKLYVEEQKGEELKAHYDYMASIPVFNRILNQLEEKGQSPPVFQIMHCAFFTHGYLMFNTLEPATEEHEIFTRFAKVFDQTYTRFLDLQKAEKQAREAEINLALERIRAATMAMHNTDEIGNTVITFFKELRGLGLQKSTRCGIGILSQSEHMQLYTASTKKGHQAKLTTGTLDMSLHPLLEGVKMAWENGDSAFSYELKGKDKYKYFDRLNTVRDYPVNIDLDTLSEIVFHFSFPFKDGVLFVFLDEPLTLEYAEICKRFARSFSLTYTRFLDLQKAENQAREAQIEAALERVRSRTMGMQKSSELEEVIKVVFDQLVHLNFNIEHTGFIIDYKENDDMHIWLTDKNSIPAEVTVPYIDTPNWNSFLKAKKNGDNFFSNLYTFEEKNKFYRELFEIIPGVAEETKSYYQNCKGLAISTVLMDDVGLYIENFEGEPFSEEENKTLLRFGKVFQQTYTRFRDLENAEAQTKQAQIEAALERVRSRSMGMQNSKDFSSVTTEMFNQLRNFGGDLFATGIVFCDKHKDHVEQWHSIPGAGMMSPFIVPKDLDYIHEYRYNQWKKGEKLFSIEIPGDFIEQHFQDIFNLPSAQKVLKDLEENDTPMPGAPPWEIDYGASFKNGYILVSALQVFEEAHILPRFAKVFEQAYTRYLDLKKAELQAREAQVEAALERIRSRSIGMQKSEDLADLSLELVKQVQELGVSTWFCAFNIYDDEEKGSLEWGSNGQGVFPKYRTPREGVFLKYYEAGQQGQSLLVNEIGEDECPAHYKYLCTLPGVGDQLLQMKAQGISFPTSQIDHVAFFKYGYLLFITYESVPESYEIFKRFARVFEQSYTRFLDLQKAEQRAREARVETALEKVRSRTLAMEYSQEFTETSMVVFEQLLELGISPNRLFIGLIDSDLDTIDAWATNEDGTRLANHFKLEASKNRSIARMLDGWKQGKTSQIIDMEGRELQNYFRYLNEELKIPFQGGLEQKRRIQYMAYFSGGLIGLASGEEQDEDALELLERFAAVFNLTYIRFKDLKVAEANAIKARQDLKEIKAARENAERALTELQQTQKQLIQSEKMASLGELTAGIAHEIQNPLNFVNNFSEVSNELLDEIAEEIEKGDLEEVREILKDIRNNLNKINHHGKRADAIVKGMLQHSRKGNSEIEPTDINVLCDEYLRLAYHGLRAKDKSFNADLETDFDPDLGNVAVMAQEIGRVILNLLTNAFYAVLQKRKNTNDPLYEPKVSISTHKEANQVLIRVKDNGCGIPKKNLDKIFQPFFTTKPTGQGTGLGLSLSYDIVKAHGGVLEVETQKGKGTTFTIIIKTNR